MSQGGFRKLYSIVNLYAFINGGLSGVVGVVGDGSARSLDNTALNISC